MKLLKNIIPLFLILACALPALGQDKRGKREEIEAKKRAFITEKLDLTVEEAEKFWPLYDEYQDKKRELRREQRKLKTEIDKMTDAEAEQLLSKHLEIKQKELDLEKVYIKKFRGVLPVKKVIRIQWAEEQFKKYLLKELRDHRREQDRR